MLAPSEVGECLLLCLFFVVLAVVISFAAWKIWSTEFVVGISIMEVRKCTVSNIRPPPVSVMYVVWHI